jgi:hypothetical protein
MEIMKKELFFIIFQILLISFSVIGQENSIIKEENNKISNKTKLSGVEKLNILNSINVNKIATKDLIKDIRASNSYIYKNPFSLILPEDSAHIDIRRPTLVWESSLDMLDRIYNYEVYINDTLRHTCLDTAWTVDYDLCEGYNNWYVIAYDSLGNPISSNEAWTVLVDISHSIIESTTVWNDTKHNGPFSIYTKVTNINGVERVLLYFKHNDDNDWSSFEMTNLKKGWYHADITKSYVKCDTVKYYIKVIDTEQINNGSTEPKGAPSSYYWFIADTESGVSGYDNIPESFSFSMKNDLLRDKVTFKIALPENALINLQINDITGKLIEKPFAGLKSAGYYEITWVPDISGVYFYSLESPWQKRVGKVVLTCTN